MSATSNVKEKTYNPKHYEISKTVKPTENGSSPAIQRHKLLQSNKEF